MSFQIHYFASASTHTGKSSESLHAPLPLSALFDTLENRYPGIREGVLGCCSVAIEGEYVDIPRDENEGNGGEGKGGQVGGEDVNKDGGSIDEEGLTTGAGRVIQPGEEVAIIPPVSSG